MVDIDEIASALQILDERRDDPWRLKTNSDTYQFFMPKCRPPRPSEALGPYLYLASAPALKVPIDELWTDFELQTPTEARNWQDLGAAHLGEIMRW